LGDALPCLLANVTILAVREIFVRPRHPALFWKLMAAGLFQMLLSQAYWFYYDSLKVYSSPSPVIGDTLFLLAHVFFFPPFVLRPHSAAAGRDMRLRHLDSRCSLSGGWPCTPLRPALATGHQDFTKYNPAFMSSR